MIDKTAWHHTFDKYGRFPEEASWFFDALLAESKNSELYALNYKDCISVFERTGEIATCRIGPRGFLPMSDNPVDVCTLLENIRYDLDVRVLYFPLVYDLFIDEHWRNLPAEAIRYARQSSPFIDLQMSRKSIVSVCRQRLGKRVSRRLRRFNTSGAEVFSALPSKGFEIVSDVERGSWKFQSGVDIFRRHQAKLIHTLLEGGYLNARYAVVNGVAIAYRLDFILQQNVFCYKWSYKEDYRHLSPGFYLLTQDLEDSYTPENISCIDLYGSPDHLKDTISSGAHMRSDIVWPNSNLAQDLARERISFDKSNMDARSAGIGIKKQFARVQ